MKSAIVRNILRDRNKNEKYKQCKGDARIRKESKRTCERICFLETPLVHHISCTTYQTSH